MNKFVEALKKQIELDTMRIVQMPLEQKGHFVDGLDDLVERGRMPRSDRGPAAHLGEYRLCGRSGPRLPTARRVRWSCGDLQASRGRH